MSKLSQELQALFYLNQQRPSNRFVSVTELSDYLETSKRQARRYVEDLMLVLDIDIEVKLGRFGGYRLRKPVDKMFFVPDNLALAISIAMKRNERIEKALSLLPDYVMHDNIDGDNQINIHVYDNIETLIRLMHAGKEVEMTYRGKEKPYVCRPYKIKYSNHNH